MSTMKIICIMFITCLGSLAEAQCTALVPGPGTGCDGPVLITTASPANQSAVILVDISLPAPTPAASKYILSIVNGTIQESDNGGAYHTLVGPKGDKGDVGVPGVSGKDGVNGQAATVAVGSVTSGSAPAVTNSGNAQNAVLNFVLQAGPQGTNPFPVGSTITATEACSMVNGQRTCILKRIK